MDSAAGVRHRLKPYTREGVNPPNSPRRKALPTEALGVARLVAPFVKTKVTLRVTITSVNVNRLLQG